MSRVATALTLAVVFLSAFLRSGPAHAAFGKLMPAPVQRALKTTSRYVGKQMTFAAAHTRTRLDAVENTLVATDKPRLALALAKVRRVGGTFSPTRLAGFAAKQVHDNPMIVPTYVSLTIATDAVRLGAAAQMPHALGAAFYVASMVPATLAELVVAHHAMQLVHSKAGGDPSLLDSLKELGSRYTLYNERQDLLVDRVVATLR